MAIANIYRCDKCSSTSQSEEYRLNASNFVQLNISLYPVGGGGPMMPGSPTGSSRNETFQICSECKSALEASINEIVNPLKAS